MMNTIYIGIVGNYETTGYEGILTGFYLWLKRNNFPEGFQTLCMNCQWLKKEENREYPKHIPKDTVMAGVNL